jgi:ParB family chromosome partitioning protein
MENRALGKGLSALIPGRADLQKENASQDAVAYVKTAIIQDNAFQPRMKYDEHKLQELAASIKEKGVLQPILVREVAGGYEVVAGERRLKAARLINLEEVPVIIKKVSEKEGFVLALVENIQREELNAIEEAEAFRRLCEEFSFTHDEVAQSVGKDRSTITNTLRLLKLPAEIQQSVSGGEISMGHARALLGVEDSRKQKELFEKIIAKGISVRELENLIKGSSAAASPHKKIKVPQRSADVVLLEEELQRFLGTKVRIQAQKKRGKIIIEYYSLEDLARVLEIIRK